MKILAFNMIVEAVAALCGKTACELPEDVLTALTEAQKCERYPHAKDFFQQYLDNSEISMSTRLPLCQDTGFAVYFVELGEDVKISGGTLREALNEGTRQGYSRYYLRKSIVDDPLFDRKNTRDNTPCIVHLEQVPGDSLKIILAPKGGGSENMSALKMLKPSDGRAGVVKFVVDTVINAGGNPCPPTIVGIGLGGTMEYAAILAKRALLRKIGENHIEPRYAELEQEILSAINASGVGAQGLGGDISSLAVNIEYHPCHLASLPVAVNLNCHAARHGEVVL